MGLSAQGMEMLCDLEEERQSLNSRTGLENCVYSILQGTGLGFQKPIEALRMLFNYCLCACMCVHGYVCAHEFIHLHMCGWMRRGPKVSYSAFY